MDGSAEEWKPVVGYEGLYEVSDRGNVRTLKPHRWGLAGSPLKPWITNWGYPDVRLSKGGRSSHRMVHSLVAEAFLGPRPDGLIVNHKDGDKTNSRRENLEYVTQRENLLHASDLGLSRRGSQMPNAKLTEDAVRLIRRRGRGYGVKRQADEFGVSPPVIQDVLRGKTWRHVIY